MKTYNVTLDCGHAQIIQRMGEPTGMIPCYQKHEGEDRYRKQYFKVRISQELKPVPDVAGRDL